MAYIYDMASGTEYPGEETACPTSSMVSQPDSRAPYGYPEVELRLAIVETGTFENERHDPLRGLDLSAMIEALED